MNMRTSLLSIITCSLLCEPFQALAETPVDADATPPTLEKPAEKPADQDFRLIWNLGLGTLTPESGDGNSGLSRGFNRAAGIHSGILGDYRYPPGPFAFEFGLSFLSVGADVKGKSRSSLRLLYLGIPLSVRYYAARVAQESKLYVVGGLQPSLLISASVDSCESVGCGIDNDLDAYLRESRSVMGDFQSYDVIASVGLGADFLLFRSQFIDAVWLLLEGRYYRGLIDIGKGGEIGSRIYNGGHLVNVGLAVDF